MNAEKPVVVDVLMTAAGQRTGAVRFGGTEAAYHLALDGDAEGAEFLLQFRPIGTTDWVTYKRFTSELVSPEPFFCIGQCVEWCFYCNTLAGGGMFCRLFGVSPGQCP